MGDLVIIKKPKIAIIGSGLSGVILGQELKEISSVKIFEKSRGCGGRMSARYAEKFSFDHGAQFFTARSEGFREFLAPFLEMHAVLPWEGEVILFKSGGSIISCRSEENLLVASPNMNSLCKKIATDLDVSLGIEVAPLTPKQSDGWHLKDKNGSHLGVYDLVISTAPIPQTKNLFVNQINLEDGLAMLPCFATMIGFNQKLDLDWIFAKTEDRVIKSIGFNSSKPDRDKNVSCFVIHSTEEWALENLEKDISGLERILVKGFEDLTGILCEKADYISTHRWRYALADKAKELEPLFDENLKLGAVGDWVCGSTIEDVWLTAKKLSQIIKTKI